MWTRQPADFPIERMTDAPPNLPRMAQAHIGRRLRAELAGTSCSDLPDEMQRLLQQLEARLAARG